MRFGTYNAAFVWILGEFAQGVACLAVVDEDLGIGADAGKVVAGWRVADVLDEFAVGFDSLEKVHKVLHMGVTGYYLPCHICKVHLSEWC